jgi:transcriptional regulator with XRE-family HTH domain
LGDFAKDLGKALWRARLAQGLTLRQVTELSNGRFKATSLAGYERGERTISIERFIALCDVYGVAPQGVLADVVPEAGERTERVLDLTRLEALGRSERALVSGFVRQIRAQRRETPSETIVLRQDDLDELATAVGTTRERLAEALEPAIRDEE